MADGQDSLKICGRKPCDEQVGRFPTFRCAVTDDRNHDGRLLLHAARNQRWPSESLSPLFRRKLSYEIEETRDIYATLERPDDVHALYSEQADLEMYTKVGLCPA